MFFMLKVYQMAVGRDFSSGEGRIEGLDGLRSLAIVGVTLFHMFPEAVPGGYMGVSLFFVLSGYLLAYTCSRQLAQGSFSVAGYFWRRVKRIYPPLLLVLLVSTGVYYFLAPDIVAAVRPEIVSVLLGYNNWWQIAQNADYFTRLINTSPFTHLWFMGIELQYYLLWPVLFFLYAVLQNFFGTRAALLFMAVLGIASACVMPLSYVPGDDVTRLYYGTDMRVYALLFGAVMGLHRADAGPCAMQSEFLRRIFCAAFAVVLSATVIAYLFLDGQNPLVYQGGMLGMTLIFCLMLRLTENRGLPFGALLDIQIFRWIGKKSYGIFLWQYPVILLFGCMGWDKSSGLYLLEIALILLLAAWSDAVTDCWLRKELPFQAKPMAIVRVACFLVLSLCSTLVMGYGCIGIASSAESRASAVAELQAQLAAEEAEQVRQNELAAEQAKAARIEAAKGQIDLSGAVCIGDSVMLGSSGRIREVLPACYVDAEVSRYVGGGLEAAKAFESQGKLGNLVVIALGTNGPIAGYERYEVQTRQLLEYLGNERHIFWVNVYCPHLTWQETNNSYIKKLAAEHGNVHEIDWYGLISQHPEWLTEDGIHPNSEGRVQYARLIHDRIEQVLVEEQVSALQ